MKVFKILHKPTGLYYTPSNGYGNLSTTGKIYARKPSLTVCIGGSIRIIIHEWNPRPFSKKLQIIADYFGFKKDEKGKCWVDTHINTPFEDWEIVEL